MQPPPNNKTTSKKVLQIRTKDRLDTNSESRSPASSLARSALTGPLLSDALKVNNLREFTRAPPTTWSRPTMT